MPRVPGPRYPATLQTMFYLAAPEPYLASCHRRYGDVFTLTTLIFGREVCVVRPEEIKKVFTGDPDELRAGEANVALEPLVGSRSVLLLDGAEHLRQRRLMMPPFHGERMVAYGAIMREITERVIDGWTIGSEVTLHPEMQRITLEVILRTIFGLDEGARLDALREAMTALLDRLASPLAMLATVPAFQREVFGLSPWAKFERAIQRADELIYAQVRRRRAERAEGAPPRDDVLSLLLDAKDEEGKGLTDAELRDELMTLLAAGHETTATELCWAFDRILREPRVLAKLEDEIDRASDRDRLPYVDATIKEALRLHPVIPAVGRRVKKTMRVAGYEVEEGTLLVPGVWLTHRQPDLYPNPESFEPERWLDKKPDPYAFLPFGGGIRRCIGMAFALFEMRVVLSTILARLELRPARPKPAKTSLRGFTHAPRGGVPVVVVRARAEPRPAVPAERRDGVSP